MTHKSGHIIIDFAESPIPMTPLKVRDVLGVLAGFLGTYYWPF